MRNRFDEQLARLHQELIQMGGLIEQAIETACQALTSRSEPLAREVMAMENKVDQMERDIESMCLRLLLQQQPVARDLRAISAALKMITDMERIGDQASDISEIVVFLSRTDTFGEPDHFRAMADATVTMVHESIDAFVRRDCALAGEVVAMDDTVDELFTQVKRELIERIGREPQKGEEAMDLLMIAKYFERIGDHAVNIAEWVEFSITGIHKGEDKA